MLKAYVIENLTAQELAVELTNLLNKFAATLATAIPTFHVIWGVGKKYTLIFITRE